MLVTADPLPQIVTYDQAAELLAVNKRTLTNYSARGWLHPFHPHGQRRALGFFDSDIRAFLDSAKTKPIEEPVVEESDEED